MGTMTAGTMTAGRILFLIDSDAALRQTLAEHLHGHPDWGNRGCGIVEAGNGGAALALLAELDDVVMLLGGLPDIAAPELIGLLRDAGRRCPVIVLADSPDAARAALKAGADDALVKPVRLGVLLTRLQQAARQPSAESELPIGPYCFRPNDKLLVDAAADRRVRLTDKEA